MKSLSKEEGKQKDVSFLPKRSEENIHIRSWKINLYLISNNTNMQMTLSGASSISPQ